MPYSLVRDSHKAAAEEAADRAEQKAIEAACPRLSELNQRQTLGVGAFGRVKLVTHYAKPDAPKVRRFSARKMEKGEKEEDGELQCYALKILSKAHIVASKQADSTIRERDILRALKHPFILRLHTTYQTAHACYFLLELVPAPTTKSASTASPLRTIVAPGGAFSGATPSRRISMRSSAPSASPESAGIARSAFFASVRPSMSASEPSMLSKSSRRTTSSSHAPSAWTVAARGSSWMSARCEESVGARARARPQWGGEGA